MFGKEHTLKQSDFRYGIPQRSLFYFNDKITKIIYKIHSSVLQDYFHKYLYAT